MSIKSVFLSDKLAKHTKNEFAFFSSSNLILALFVRIDTKVGRSVYKAFGSNDLNVIIYKAYLDIAFLT